METTLSSNYGLCRAGDCNPVLNQAETPGVYVAEADLEPGEVQSFEESIPELLNLTAATDTPLRFHVRVEVGSEKNPADKAVVGAISAELRKVGGKMRLF